MQKITRIAAILLVVLAFVLALLAFGLGRHATQQPAAAALPVQAAPVAATQNQGVPVVVASEALPAGQAIARSALHIADVAQAPQNSFGSPEAVAGQLPLVTIPAGTPITAELLAHGMALQVIPGERALAVPVDEVAGVANRILPGDYVDVFLSLKNPPNATLSGQNRDHSQTRLLLSRLRVLAYGQRNLPVPASASTAAAALKNDVADAPRTAVLAVPVTDIDQLLLGAQNGKLTLALRYPGDESRPDRQWFPQPPTVLSSLVGSGEQTPHAPDNHAYAGIDGAGLAGEGAALPRLAPRRHVELAGGVEIIRGAQRNDTTGNHSP